MTHSKDDTMAGCIIPTIIICFLAFCIALIGYSVGERHARQAAVDAGVGEWYADDGDQVKFRFKGGDAQ